MEWGKCAVPLVNSAKVKVLGRCLAAPENLYMMQEIVLYLSSYIHHSIVTELDKSTWRLEAPSNIDSAVYPLLTLLKLLKIKPYQESDPNEAVVILPISKRRKGTQRPPEQNKDEQAISDSYLSKLVGAADAYNLEEIEPPRTLMCESRVYQK